MQHFKQLVIDLIKISSIAVGITLIFFLIGFLTGAKSQQDKSIEFIKNINYAIQQKIEDL